MHMPFSTITFHPYDLDQVTDQVVREFDAQQIAYWRTLMDQFTSCMEVKTLPIGEGRDARDTARLFIVADVKRDAIKNV